MTTYKAKYKTKDEENSNFRLSALAFSLAVCLVGVTPVQAASEASNTNEWTHKKIGITAATAVAGAALGGPVGLVLGTAAGDWLGNNVNKAELVSELEGELILTQAERDDAIEQREQALANLMREDMELLMAQDDVNHILDIDLSSMQMNIMFSTADDKIKPQAFARLDALASVLKDRSHVDVYLAGFADPRGADLYNMALSERRAESVQNYLIGKGVNTSRIHISAHGSRKSDAPRNDLDAYAMERVVTIALEERASEQAVAEVNGSHQQDIDLSFMQMNVMFSTADDQVKSHAFARLDALAEALKDNPQLKLHLAGFADPRGADLYNMALSERRAKNVQNYLIGKGISASRIQISAYGSGQSEAPRNDMDAYAMERVVTIAIEKQVLNVASAK